MKSLALAFASANIPAACLLDKDGNILAKGLRSNVLEQTVSKALGVD